MIPFFVPLLAQRSGLAWAYLIRNYDREHQARLCSSTSLRRYHNVFPSYALENLIGLGGLGHIGVKIAHALGAEVSVLSHSPIIIGICNPSSPYSASVSSRLSCFISSFFWVASFAVFDVNNDAPFFCLARCPPIHSSLNPLLCGIPIPSSF